MRRTAICALLAVAACSAAGTTEGFDAGPDSGAPPPADAGFDGGFDGGPVGLTDAGADAGADAGPFVILADGGLFVGGTQIFPYGGDLQYFRVRDPNFDAGVTWDMWSQSLDLMADAGMNLVTTYVPWDYHNPSEGEWDFTGAKDLGHFLSMACGRGFKVVLKPGPLIGAEWPDGWGHYGAVPAWWKTAHPESLVLTSSGSDFDYNPVNSTDQTQYQATYLDPEYLAAVQDYFAHLFPIVDPYKGSCLIGLQIDNETALYWGNIFGSVDYSPTAMTSYQAFLEQKYGNSIAALNTAYGTTYGAFSDVVPPSAAPTTYAENPPAADWYWAGQAYVGAYLNVLAGMVEDAGYGPDQLLHFTNDSPFAASYGTIQIQNSLLHDRATKAPFGVPALDLYPKQDPTSSALQDQPFQADYFTSAWELQHDPGDEPVNFVYAAEMQGGWFSYPVIGSPNVQPQETDQILARSIGHGLRGASFYVVRGGINADNSSYDYEAAIGADGTTRPRYQVMQTWGTFLQSYGLDLQGAGELRNSVAILDNALYAAPQGNLDDNMQLLHTQEQPALFGWLENAGIDPAVLDSQTVSPAELQQYAVVFFQNPDYVDDATSTLLANYVQGGGLLVNFLWAGEYDQDFQSSTASQFLSTQIFPAAQNGSYLWETNTARTGSFNATFGDGGAAFNGQVTSCWYESYWNDVNNVLQPFAWEETEPLGTNGRLMGYLAQDSLGERVFLGTNVFSLYNRENYYGLDSGDLTTGLQLAQWLVGIAGEAPIVSIAPQELVWARRSPKRIYLFVVDDSGVGGMQTIQINDPVRLGLSSSATYQVTELLTQTSLGTLNESALVANGIQVSLTAYGTAVVGLTAQ